MQQSKQGASALRVIQGGKASAQKSASQRRAVTLQERITTEAGIGECSQLCDAFQMERVCDLVVADFAAARYGGVPSLPQSLQKNLIDPLERFLATLVVPGRRGRRMEEAPTEDLISAVGKTIRCLETGPWGEADAKAARHHLRYAWSIWIAYIASYWMTMEVPRGLAIAEVRREQGRKGGNAEKRGSLRSTGNASSIVAECERLAQSLHERNVASSARQNLESKGLRVSVAYVRRVWKAHLSEKKTNQQASL